MKRKHLKAFMTIEMSFLLPLILFVFMGIILTVFFYYDKNILNGAAYETAVTGSMKVRQNEGITEDELEAYCRRKINGKCIMMNNYTVNVKIQEEEIIVEINAVKRAFQISVIKRAALTEPEERIRDIRRLKIRDGT